MSPGAVADRIKGGHLYIPELKVAILETREIKSLGKGFFDMEIKYAGKVAEKYKNNSYFPAGTSIEQAIEMLEKAIKNPKKIKGVGTKNEIFSFELTDIYDHIFKFNIKNDVAQFHPLNPEALKLI